MKTKLCAKCGLSVMLGRNDNPQANCAKYCMPCADALEAARREAVKAARKQKK